ncbi:MAG: hypothetical protein HeimC2_03310 [Candidatus Heimdallarchaeota archaeon LC_2]|nr:MAG: hypothetical protein HeimC2_03310 [Candidatus Heimdallarchaeota archaeon LC_2]
MKNLIFDFELDLLSNSEYSEIIDFLNVTDVGIEAHISDLLDLNKAGSINGFSKLTLRESEGINTKNLKNELSKNRKKFELIIVEPLSAGVAAIAARDRRVDGVRISQNSMLKIFNTRYGRRLSENKKLVVIDLSLFWDGHLAKNLRPLFRVLRSFSKCNLQYILSKKSNHVSKLRTYRGLQSIGRLLGISNKQSDLKSLKELINKNQKKIEGKIPIEGVEIIEW